MKSASPTAFKVAPDRVLFALFISGACNLNCTYCYFRRRDQPPMSCGVAAAALDLIKRWPASRKEIGFFGVEPMLAWDLLKQMLEQGRRMMPEASWSVNTNGTLFTRRRLDYLRNRGVKLAVSLDGLREWHDRLRPDPAGRSSYARLARHFPALTKYQPPVTARLTIVPETAALADRLLRAVFDAGFQRLSFSADFTAPWTTKAIREMKSAIARFAGDYEARLRRGENVEAPALDSIGKGRQAPARGLYCGAGTQLFAIDTAGRIYPCWRYAGERRKPLGDVFRGVKPNRLKPFRDCLANSTERCRRCPLNKQCGRCAWVGEKMAGGMNRVTAAQCGFSQAVISAGSKLARRMLKERNEIFLGRLARRSSAGVVTDDGRVYFSTAEGRHFCVPPGAMASPSR